MELPDTSIMDRLGVTSPQLRSFCERWGVLELAVFGSAATDRPAPSSDVDVLLHFAPSRTPRLCDLIDARVELESLFRRTVDLLTRGVLDAAPDDRFSRAIRESRRVLYAA